jgi:thioredoxin-like negative regulator of GroEL
MIVDVNMNPMLAQEYGVEIIPSYFVSKDGKKSNMQAGAMDEKSMTNYLNENKKGTSLKKK